MRKALIVEACLNKAILLGLWLCTVLLSGCVYRGTLFVSTEPESLLHSDKARVTITHALGLMGGTGSYTILMDVTDSSSLNAQNVFCTLAPQCALIEKEGEGLTAFKYNQFYILDGNAYRSRKMLQVRVPGELSKAALSGSSFTLDVGKLSTYDPGTFGYETAFAFQAAAAAGLLIAFLDRETAQIDKRTFEEYICSTHHYGDAVAVLTYKDDTVTWDCDPGKRIFYAIWMGVETSSTPLHEFDLKAGQHYHFEIRRKMVGEKLWIEQIQ